MAEEVLSLLTLSPFKLLHPHVLCIWLIATLKGVGQLPAFGGVACKTIPQKCSEVAVKCRPGLSLHRYYFPISNLLF